MNPDQPSREQIEARITALLLGELPADEAALLRYTIAQDSELQKLHDELQAALPLVREAEKTPVDAPVEASAQLKLSAERRQKLLEHFKTARATDAAETHAKPEPLFWLKRIEMPRLVPVLVAVAIIALLAAMLLPALSAAKSKSSHRHVAFQSASSRTDSDKAAMAAAHRTWSAENEQRQPMQVTTASGSSDSFMVMTNSVLAPQIVTVAPAAAIAPPPAPLGQSQIVLPKSEPAAETPPLAGGPAETGGVYSQNIVGYVNLPPNPTQLAFDNDGKFQPSVVQKKSEQSSNDRLAYVEKQWIIPHSSPGLERNGTVSGVVNAYAGAGGFGGGGAYANTPTVESAGLPAQAAPPPPAAAPAPAEMPAAGFAFSAGQTADESNVERAKKPITTADAQNHGTAGLAGNRYYRSLAKKAEEPKVADSNMLGFDWYLGQYQQPIHSATPRPVATLAPATDKEYTIVSGDTLSQIARRDGVTLKALEEANPGVDPKKLRPGKKLVIPTPAESTIAAATPVATETEVRAPMPTLDSQSQATINSRRVDEMKTYNEQLVQLQQLKALQQTNPAKLRQVLPTVVQDASLNQMLLTLNDLKLTAMLTNDYVSPATPKMRSRIDELNHKIDDRTAGIMEGLESKVGASKAAIDAYSAKVEEARETERKNAQESQPYYDAQRELAEKLEMHKLLYSKLEAEKVDLGLPKSSMVLITDPAEPITNQTFWHHLTGQYSSTARIKVANDVTDIPGMNTATPAYQTYDPYFIQTTFEVIQSENMLSNVVSKLDLPSVWGKKMGTGKLSEADAIRELKKRLTLQPVKNTKLISISVTSDDPNEAANIANAVAQAYRDYLFESRKQLTKEGIAALEEQFQQQEHDIATNQLYLEHLRQGLQIDDDSSTENAKADLPLRKPAPNTPVPQPEILVRDNNFSTFSLNVSDVSFKFAEASLQNGKLPDTASIRSEEFINAFDYRDPEARAGQAMAFTSECAHYPFAHNRDLLRFAIKTAATGRQAGRALNLVLLLDVSGSMERADRVAIIHEALRVLATQLQPQDTVSVVTFSRTARLWADGVSGDKAGETLDRVGGITPEGGTNLEEAMRLAYETAHRHYLANGMNRVVLLTDGAANLGDVSPSDLKKKVEAQRKQGIALDCFGIGWEDYNDDLLEQLSSTGDGRYAFLNSPEDASKDFASKLAGALQIAAADVKVQVEFNPKRVISYRQIGYATHQLTKEQFRDNTVAAGQIAAQEAGNALYTIETNPNGDGPIAIVHVRYKVPGTEEYREASWNVDYTGNAPALEQSSSAMRLAATASAFSEWLAASPYAQEVTPDELLKYLSGVPEIYGADDRPKQLETMIREAKSLEGK